MPQADPFEARAPPLPRAERWLGAWNAVVFLGWAVLPFAGAGTAGWRRGWLHLGALAVAATSHRLYLRRTHPALLRRRAHIRQGTPTWDLWWNALFWPAMAAIAAVAGLDAHGGAPSLPGWTWVPGLALLAAGFGLSAAAMAANPFFEGTVRVQRELDQRPVEAGPYARIRHPGHAGLALWALATPLLLGSSWSFVPAFAAVVWVMIRTALEDSFLRRELPGYAGYAGRVRWRLVPGLW